MIQRAWLAIFALAAISGACGVAPDRGEVIVASPQAIEADNGTPPISAVATTSAPNPLLRSTSSTEPRIESRQTGSSSTTQPVAHLAALWIRQYPTNAVRINAIDSVGDLVAVATGVRGRNVAEIELWRVTGTEAQRLDSVAAHVSNVADVAFAVGGSRLYSSGEDGEVLVWEVTDGRLLATESSAKIHTSSASLQLDLNGDRLVSFGRDQTVKLWSISAGFGAGPIDQWALGGEVNDFVLGDLDSDSIGFAVTNDDILFSLRSGGELIQIGAGSGAETVVKLSDSLALGAADGVGGFTTLAQPVDLDAPATPGPVLAMDLGSNDSYELLAVGGQDGLVGYAFAWMNQPNSPVVQLGSFGDRVTSIEIMDDNRRVVVGDRGAQLTILALDVAAGSFPSG